MSSKARHLQDIILGGQDGLVNVLGLSIGVAGATGDASLVIISSTAAMFAESISMGAVAYTSSKAAIAYEKKRAHTAGMAKEEIEGIISKLKNLPKQKLAFIRYRLLSHDECNGEITKPSHKAVKVWLSTMAGSLIPLSPYFFIPDVWQAAMASITFSAIALFTTGAIKAKWTIGDWKTSGAEMLAVGGLATVAGFFIGVLLKAHL